MALQDDWKRNRLWDTLRRRTCSEVTRGCADIPQKCPKGNDMGAVVVFYAIHLVPIGVNFQTRALTTKKSDRQNSVFMFDPVNVLLARKPDVPFLATPFPSHLNTVSRQSFGKERWKPKPCKLDRVGRGHHFCAIAREEWVSPCWTFVVLIAAAYNAHHMSHAWSVSHCFSIMLQMISPVPEGMRTSLQRMEDAETHVCVALLHLSHQEQRSLLIRWRFRHLQLGFGHNARHLLAPTS